MATVEQPDICLFNGQIVHQSSVDALQVQHGQGAIPAMPFPLPDRGLAYGDGLFETILVSQGSCPFWPLHRERLIAGCQKLAIPLDTAVLDLEYQQFLSYVVRDRLAGDKSSPASKAIIKLIVTRGVGGQGYAPLTKPNPNRIWQQRALPEQVAPDRIKLTTSSLLLSQQPILAGLKHLNRLEYVLAAQACPQGYQPLLLDQSGHVVETLSHNIFCVHKTDSGRSLITTPRLSRCGVAGVLRRWLIEQAPEVGYTIHEDDFTLPDLMSASEVFIGNSVRGVGPVSEIDHVAFSVGPASRALQALHQRYIDSFCYV